MKPDHITAHYAFSCNQDNEWHLLLHLKKTITQATEEELSSCSRNKVQR